MGLKDIIKSVLPLPKRDLMTLRPTELDIWTRGSADVAKLPTVPFLGFRFVSEIYMYSDLLKTIIRSLVQETFRKGITIVPKFVVKCNICGTDYDTRVERCEVCGSDSLRPPNPFEKKWMESFMHDVNYNNQSLVEVLQDVDTDLNIYDNAYLAVVKRYDFDKDGKVIGAEVIEVVRAYPENVLLIMDREGRPARTDDGRVVLICLEHRDRYTAVPPEQVENARCPICGKHLYPAYFAVRKSVGQGGLIYYTDGEILHIKKFTHGLGYGLSPIFAVWMKVMTLIKQDFFILTAYHLERSPRGLLILRGQMESIQKAWHRLQEEAKTNPHIIYPLVIEGADNVNRVAEWLDLSFSAKDIDFINYREEVRRTVGALWGVMPIFHGDTSGGVGLANEGLQIVVTNRAVEREQTLFNDKVLPWLTNQLGIMDWEFKLIPNEGRDMVARIQRETMRIANAERMARLGYRPVAIKTDDGIDFYYEYAGEPIKEDKKSGYIASKVYQEVPEREIPRYEGEPEHGRPRTKEQRFEGEELARRPKKPTTYIVGEGGELIPEEPAEIEDVEEGLEILEKREKLPVPPEYRRYIDEADLPKLPPGTRVYEGPRGGLFYDIREVPELVRVTEEEAEQDVGVGGRGRRRREVGGVEEEVEAPEPEEEVEKPESRRVPEEHRRYVSREHVARLPRGLRVYRSADGKLYIDAREYRRLVGRDIDEEEWFEETRPILRPQKEAEEVVYEGDYDKKIKYKLKIEKEENKATVLISSALGDTLELEVDLADEDVRIADFKLQTSQLGWLSRLFGGHMEKLRQPHSEDELYKIVWPLEAGIPTSYLDEIVEKQKKHSLETAKVLLGDQKGSDKDYKAKILFWKDVSEGSKVKFYYLETLQTEAKKVFEENINIFKNYFSDKFGGYLIFVPHTAFRWAGGVYTNQAVALVANNDMGSLLHEYLHYVFHQFAELLSLEGYVYRTFGAFMSTVFGSIGSEKSVSLSSVIEGIKNKAKSGGDVPREALKVVEILERKLLGDRLELEKVLGRLLADYLRRTEIREPVSRKDFDDHTLVFKYVAKKRLQLFDAVVKYFGGEKALRMFENLVERWETDDGVTEYSMRYHANEDPKTLTESLASVGDLLGYFLSLGRRLGLKMTKQNVLEFYKRMPPRNFNYSFHTFIKGKDEMVKETLDFLETIGFVRWEE